MSSQMLIWDNKSTKHVWGVGANASKLRLTQAFVLNASDARYPNKENKKVYSVSCARLEAVNVLGSNLNVCLHSTFKQPAH